MKKLILSLSILLALVVGLTSPAGAVIDPPVWQDESEAWPSATNTGPTLTLSNPETVNGNVTLSTNFSTYQNKIVNGNIYVTGQYVTIQNVDLNGCILVQNSATTYIYHVDIDTTCTRGIDIRPWAHNENSRVVAQYIEIDGNDTAAECIGFYGYTIRYSDLHHCVDGAKGSDNTTLTMNYIHDLHHPTGAHADGIQIQSGNYIRIQGNNIDLLGQNSGSAGIIVGNQYGDPSDIWIEGNRVVAEHSGSKALNAGGAFTDPPNGDNRISRNIFDAPNGTDWIFNDCADVITTPKNEDLAGNQHTFC